MVSNSSLREEPLQAGGSEERQVLTYEEALVLVGTGRVQRRMLLLCGLANASDAVELLCVSLVLPAVGPDGASLRLSVPQLASLSAALFWGAMVGTLVWGALSDAIGRRKSLSLAMAVAGSFGLLSATAGSFGTLVLCRTLAGIGVGGSIPVVYAWLSEWLTTEARGRYMVLLASSWMVGSICTALAGLAVVPRHPVNGWRWFLALAALPSAVCCVWAHMTAPESPRWLLSRGRSEEALALLRKAAADNGREGAIPVHATLSKPKAGADAASGSLVEMLKVQGKAIVSLFSPPLRKISLPLCLVWFGISLGWYGTVLWFPEYFKSRAAAANIAPPGPPPAPGAPPPHLDASPFTAQLAVAASNLPGNLVSMWSVDALGRRMTLASSLAAGALAALAFAFMPANAGQGGALAAACAFNALSVGAWNALECYSAELLPTSVRASGLGVFSAAGKFGSIAGQMVNGALLPVAQWAPLLPGVGTMLLAAVLVMRMSTETRGRAMMDDVPNESTRDAGGSDDGDGAAGDDETGVVRHASDVQDVELTHLLSKHGDVDRT